MNRTNIIGAFIPYLKDRVFPLLCHKRNFWMYALEWCIFFLAGCAIIIFLSFLSSCCSPKVVPPNVEYRDSIQIVVKDRIVHDTVPFYVPAESSSEVTPDDSSHLETSFAVSDAWIRDGLLHHLLKNKEQQIDIPHDVIVSDTTTTHSNQTTVTVTEYVEKKLSWWQSLCIKWFPWTLIAFVLLLAWTIKRLVSKF